MKRRQIRAPGLGYDAKLIIGHCLEQRLGKQVQALDLFSWFATILGLVLGT